MLSQAQADAFVLEWLAAWNARDLERILSQWAPDCTFTSPLVTTLLGDPSGKVRGKDALRAYWQRGITILPNLRFSIQAVLVGHDSVVIHYRNDRDQSCAEWIRLNPEGLAVEGAAHYDT